MGKNLNEKTGSSVMPWSKTLSIIRIGDSVLLPKLDVDLSDLLVVKV